MAHAKATIGTTNYAVSITAGHHELNADEGPELGGQDTELLFIVQEKTAPYLVNVVGIDYFAREIGRAKNRAAIEVFAECTASGKWPGYSDTDPNYLALPGWAENRDKDIYL